MGPPQLDILALEPFYGGIRRSMLQTIIRCSRHRWTLLKLPARRMERRLVTASKWFAEQISRGDIGKMDLLFTSEAINLADFHQLAPKMASRPSVVYFHDNQLPALPAASSAPAAAMKQRRPPVPVESGLDLVHLNTAMAATQLWFNSKYHQSNFMTRAAAVIHQHAELANRNPLSQLEAKSHYVPPAIDLNSIHEIAEAEKIPRGPRTLFVDLRESDVQVIADAFAKLREREEACEWITVGPQAGLPDDMPRIIVHERDVSGQIRGLLQSSVYISAKIGATCDELLVKGLVAGLWPVVPDSGVYPELLPSILHANCLHAGNADSLAKRILDAFYAERPHDIIYKDELIDTVQQFDGVRACRHIDERLEQLVQSHSR